MVLEAALADANDSLSTLQGKSAANSEAFFSERMVEYSAENGRLKLSVDGLQAQLGVRTTPSLPTHRCATNARWRRMVEL